MGPIMAGSTRKSSLIAVDTIQKLGLGTVCKFLFFVARLKCFCGGKEVGDAINSVLTAYNNSCSSRKERDVISSFK